MSQQQQQTKQHTARSRGGSKMEQGPRKLNQSAAPIKSITKNNSMKMKSKAFAAKRRTQNGPTNTSKKAVSKMTSGMKGAGKSIGKKRFATPSATQTKPAQMAQPGQRALYKAATMQPAMASVKAKKGPALPKTYAASQKSVRKAMGYNS